MKEIFESNGKLYLVKRYINKEYFKTKEDIKLYRDYIFTDHVLMYKNFYVFCDTIDDAVILE